MKRPLVAPPELAPQLPAELSAEQSIAAWLDLMHATESMLLAGLRREIGPDGDLRAAYRRWYAEHMLEHDRAMEHMLAELDRRGANYGR